MVDTKLFEEAMGDSFGIEIVLPKDTRVFRKSGTNSKTIFAEKYGLKEGDEILVGNAGEVLELEYDHRKIEFVPWLDDPNLEENPEDETVVRYIQLDDLPSSWYSPAKK